MLLAGFRDRCGGHAAGYHRLARVAKLADAAPLKGAIPLGCAGSSPAPGITNHYTR